MASKFHLLEGISSFQQFVEDPGVDGGGRRSMSTPDTTPRWWRRR
jgi:hypothetical protein